MRGGPRLAAARQGVSGGGGESDEGLALPGAPVKECGQLWRRRVRLKGLRQPSSQWRSGQSAGELPSSEGDWTQCSGGSREEADCH